MTVLAKFFSTCEIAGCASIGFRHIGQAGPCIFMCDSIASFSKLHPQERVHGAIIVSSVMWHFIMSSRWSLDSFWAFSMAFSMSKLLAELFVFFMRPAATARPILPGGVSSMRDHPQLVSLRSSMSAEGTRSRCREKGGNVCNLKFCGNHLTK